MESRCVWCCWADGPLGTSELSSSTLWRNHELFLLQSSLIPRSTRGQEAIYLLAAQTLRVNVAGMQRSTPPLFWEKNTSTLNECSNRRHYGPKKSKKYRDYIYVTQQRQSPTILREPHWSSHVTKWTQDVHLTPLCMWMRCKNISPHDITSLCVTDKETQTLSHVNMNCASSYRIIVDWQEHWGQLYTSLTTRGSSLVTNHSCKTLPALCVTMVTLWPTETSMNKNYNPS